MEEKETKFILLVEDNPGDIFLTQQAFRESKTTNIIQVVKNGVECMEFLRKEGRFAGVQMPDMILLDLNLPKKNGREVLAEVKHDDKLKFIPVIVLTSSQNESDIISSYQLNANCYITKPVDYDEFIRIIKSIENFWFTTVRLPKKCLN
ncbi:MAG: response regulator [Ignavibacteria bacterium]|jgi:two-component system response regulator|nr:response regulator [Ignavibacteria bacterium]MCU7501533.1 response regulator [Ignavibacteria bacterium]MCU7515951.1 response regulator [Ignavibacteria bacterium]